jgi:DNA-directed RNA polymerase subunit RPC12/RpoP
MSVRLGKARPAQISGVASQSFACPKCSAPVEADDTFCPNCGAVLAPKGEPETSEPASVGFRCEQCGAEVRCEPDSRSTTCPFCAAPYVVEFDPKASGRQNPEFVIGFGITPERAEQIYRQWIGASSAIRPGDLSQVAQAGKLRGIYLPFWSFTMKAQSRWSSQIGEHWYRTETYTTTNAEGKTVTMTRQVQETEWWPLQGGHHAYHSFYLVSGSKGLPQQVSSWIEPFQLLALKRYAPRYLAGWLSEEYSVAKEAALVLSKDEFLRRERAQITAFLPGDTYATLEVETDFSKINSDLILLPIYLRSYLYHGKLYRTLVNGQTGKIDGEKPLSAGRIALIVGLVALLALLFVLLFGLLNGGLSR